MKHFSIKKMSMALVLLVIGCTTLHARKKRHKDKECSVKYVKGGAPDGGNGSRQHPYNDLRIAQADFSWSKLVVLPSFVPLDYGITLRPGTKLIGELPDHPWPKVDCDFPIITNTTTAPTLSNGGNGAIVTGDVTIKNIHFQDTQASAIQYSNAQNLTVNNVLITGHNQGNVNFTDFLGILYRVGGIFGELSTSGTTCLHNVVIRDNNTGDGVIEYALAGSNRTFIAKECDISRLTSNVESEAATEISGITLIAGQEGTKHCNEVTCCSIHDFLPQPPAIPTIGNRHNFKQNFPTDTFGIRIESQENGQSCSTIEKSALQNLDTSDSINTFHLAHRSFGDISTLKQIITVKHCLFEEPEENSLAFGIFNTTANGSVQSTFLDNTLKNIRFSILTLFTSSFLATHDDCIIGNCASNTGIFYGVGNSDNSILSACIANNNVNGGAFASAITISSAAPWKKLFIKIRDNCFDNFFFGFLGEGAVDSAGTNAIIDAGMSPQDPGKNNITSQSFHIQDDGTGIQYFAEENWWGPNGIPNTQVTPPSTVDVSNPLPAPAKCPLKCTCSHEVSSTQNNTAYQRTLPTKEELEQVKAHYLKRFKILTKTDHETPATKDAPTETSLPIKEDLHTKKESDSLVAKILKFFNLG